MNTRDLIAGACVWCVGLAACASASDGGFLLPPRGALPADRTIPPVRLVPMGQLAAACSAAALGATVEPRAIGCTVKINGRAALVIVPSPETWTGAWLAWVANLEHEDGHVQLPGGGHEAFVHRAFP